MSLLYEPIFRAFQENDVRYLVVGGVATVFHGHFRFTGDLDLIVHLEQENCRRALQSLVSLGFKPRAPVDPFDFANPSKRKEWIDSKGLVVFSLGGSAIIPAEVDLFVEEPYDFEELWGKRKIIQGDGVVANVVDLETLLSLKRGTGRDRDREDIEALERILE